MEDEEGNSSPEPDYRPLIPSASSSRMSTSCMNNNSGSRVNGNLHRSANLSQSTHADTANPLIAVSCETSLSLSSVSILLPIRGIAINYLDFRFQLIRPDHQAFRPHSPLAVKQQTAKDVTHLQTFLPLILHHQRQHP